MNKLAKNQLSQIKISGYKSIKNAELTLDKINVLIGCNGAGKSNFISVFSLIQNVLNKQLQLYSQKTGVNSLLYNGRKHTNTISLEVDFGVNSYGFDLSVTDSGSLVFEREYFGYHENFDNRTTIANGHMESVWQRGTHNAIGDYVLPVLEEQSWRVYHFHDTSRDARVKQEHSIGNNLALNFDASNLAAFLYMLRQAYPKEYARIVSTIQLVAPYFDDFVLEPNEYNNELISLRWKQVGVDDVFYASQLSDGTLRFICLATLFLQPEKFQPATIIVDEPELGLHPFAIVILGELIRGASINKQIIISTQSVELLNEFEPEDIVVADRNSEGTVFKRLDSNELELWLQNDYSLGDLWKKNLLGGRLSQ